MSPPPAYTSGDKQLERLYLECWDDVPRGRGFTAPGRQILHCTFGSVLTSDQFGPLLHDLLRVHQATYTEVLADHFSRHLDALRSGM
jgi:tagaturonate epimerase